MPNRSPFLLKFIRSIPMLAAATCTLAAVGATTIFNPQRQSAQAVQVGNGKVYFDHPPSLLDTETTNEYVYSWNATYYFKIDVPADAGEPLEQVVIYQYNGGDRVDFNLRRSLAFRGDRRGERVPFEAIIEQDAETDAIAVNFDPPVNPGEVVTIGLKPVRNPRYADIYLFSVTAFPQGEIAHGQFLGYGRLHIYNPSHNRW
ncbi:hypothetical protein Pse7367_0688 [Thalassoporum mexicanum PCC 7367]|uniref:DUF2808 domain-containing protein n=1 Tax=Thalassoporum mexicanum TaxID=3457544 RepID=UPI00029F8A72|nr:DUF2808 domain-containing protein [Pseudanabaena sp. PCC 7367]AFY68990.1 hypothetical protein Pse7367_0688 [Pseudanabaena sp. PCC 7367]